MRWFRLNRSSILVTVDYYSEKVFNIDTSQITPPVDPQYYLNTPTLSSDSVTVSGPKQEVDQVAKVTIPYEQDKTPLTETKHFTGRLVMLDADGNEIKSDNLTLSMESVEVTCNVLYRKVLPLQVEFSGRPSNLTGFESRVTVEPKEIEVAGPEDAFANISELTLPAIDFSTISPTSNEFDVDVSLPTGFKNVSNIYTAKVSIDLDTFTTRTVSLNPETITFKNLPAGYEAAVYTQSLSVTAVGPPDEIEAFTENNLVAQIDMTGKEQFTGQTEVPVTISVTGAPNSWVYGSYMVNIGVSAKWNNKRYARTYEKEQACLTAGCSFLCFPEKSRTVWKSIWEHRPWVLNKNCQNGTIKLCKMIVCFHDERS